MEKRRADTFNVHAWKRREQPASQPTSRCRRINLTGFRCAASHPVHVSMHNNKLILNNGNSMETHTQKNGTNDDDGGEAEDE